MSDWGRAVYGDPCRQCGFSWTMTTEDAMALVTEMPRLYATTLSGATGRERHPELSWTTGAYVCHVADNLRIWAERIAGVNEGADAGVEAYDENRVAEARGYERITLAAALWSLRRAAADWNSVVEVANPHGVLLVHSQRGELSLADVVLANAHDAFHHLWDVRRILAADQL